MTWMKAVVAGFLIVACSAMTFKKNKPAVQKPSEEVKAAAAKERAAVQAILKPVPAALKTSLLEKPKEKPKLKEGQKGKGKGKAKAKAKKEESEKTFFLDQRSNEKLTKQEFEKRTEEHTSGAMKDVGPIDDYLEMWYVNLKDNKDRRECMDKQIAEMKVKSHRFAAFSFKRCRSAAEDNLEQCLIQKKYGDCVKGGLNLGAVSTHGSAASSSDLERQYHIVSNWCSHKRMMTQMLKEHKAKNSTAKYAVLLEDDVAFDRKDFLRKVVNFCETYNGHQNNTWQMVQIDPFGSKCDKHVVGEFEASPVWKPKNVNTGWECSNYWGAQALLIRFSEIPNIIKHMELHPTVPLDWLPAKLPGGLAWQANIALNPEASRSIGAGSVGVQKWVKFPDYCRKTVRDTTIGFRQKTLARDFALAQTSGDHVLDAAMVAKDLEGKEYDELAQKYNNYNPMGKYSDWMDLQEKSREELAKYGLQ